MKEIIFSHIGKRKENQDLVISIPLRSNNHLFIVTDGMGGYSNGAKASKIISESISTYLLSIKVISHDSIQKAINKANLAIKQELKNSTIKMGATLAGIVIQENVAKCFWVGDVQILHLREGKLQYQSKSHSLLNEIVDNGNITNPDKIAKFKHVVTRSVQGDVGRSKIDYHEIAIQKNDILTISTDGVHDIFSPVQFQYSLKKIGSIEETLRSLEERLLVEAQDNYSCCGIIID